MFPCDVWLHAQLVARALDVARLEAASAEDRVATAASSRAAEARNKKARV